MDTINRLLKKQAPKRRGKLSAAELAGTSEASGAGDTTTPAEVERANPLFVRWVSDGKGCRVGVPGEWLEAGVLRGVV